MMEVCAVRGNRLVRQICDAVCAALALALLPCSHLPEKLAHEPSREPPGTVAREARAEAEAAGGRAAWLPGFIKSWN